MTDLSAFRSGAAFYDALFDPEARAKREAPFLRRVLEQAPGKRVADIACGTGFHAHLLAEMGASVDAFDLSDAMLDRARTVRSHPNVRYAQGDMRKTAGGPWGLVVCLGNSLALLPDARALEETFASVHATLANGGLFLVQVLNFERLRNRPPIHLVKEKELAGVHVTAVKNTVPGSHQTWLSLAFFAEARGEVTSLAETAVLRHVNRETLHGCAEGHGFWVDQVHGGLQGAPFGVDESSDLVMLFRRD